MKGMNQTEVMTLKAVILYIINNTNDDKCDVYHIVKTAYYAQQLHFSEYATPLFMDEFHALKFGPVPSKIYDILRVARGDVRSKDFLHDERLVEIASSINFSDEYYSSKEDPDMSYLSKSNVECLDMAIEKVSQMTFESIVSDTHGEEWKRAYGSDSKILDDINIAKEAGADEAHLEYLKDSLEIEKLLG